jgi:hypothetical protein
VAVACALPGRSSTDGNRRPPPPSRTYPRQGDGDPTIASNVQRAARRPRCPRPARHLRRVVCSAYARTPAGSSPVSEDARAATQTACWVPFAPDCKSSGGSSSTDCRWVWCDSTAARRTRYIENPQRRIALLFPAESAAGPCSPIPSRQDWKAKKRPKARSPQARP